jgi:hypothetical protein
MYSELEVLVEVSPLLSILAPAYNIPWIGWTCNVLIQINIFY